MLDIISPILVSGLLGWLVLRLFFRPVGIWLSTAFYALVGLPIGAAILGVTTFFTFVAYRPGLRSLWIAFLVPAALAGTIGWIISVTKMFRPIPLKASTSGQAAVVGILAVSLLVVCFSVGLLLACSFRTFPHGLWDAHAIWNARARVLYRAADWRDVFLTEHPLPDYPLTLSTLVFSGWTALRRETQVVPFAIATAMLFAAAGAIAAGITIWKNLAWGLVAANLLLCSFGYVSLAFALYADVPLSSAFAAALVVFTLAYREGEGNKPALIAAGCAAGLCAWIKNEGSLMILGLTVGLVVASIIVRKPFRGWFSELICFTVGAAVPTALLRYYHSYTPPSYFTLALSGATFHDKIMNGQRWLTIAKAGGSAALKAPNYTVPLVVAVALIWLIAGIRVEDRLRVPFLASFIAICVVSTGYFMAYLVTPHPLEWQLATSANRLALQLMPAFVFVALMLVRADFLQGRAVEPENAKAAMTAAVAVAPPSSARRVRSSTRRRR